jgi:hypothetical protein
MLEGGGMSARNTLCRLAILLPIFVAGCSTPLTGTPLDLTSFGAIISAVGLLYWLLAAGALWVAIAYSPTRRRKVIAGLIVMAVFGYFPLTHYRQEYLALEAVKTRLAKADAMFQERCKKAGEKIYRTAENVEGVFLMKVRPVEIYRDDQFKMDDPYGRDFGGNGYIESFLREEFKMTHADIPKKNVHTRYGYQYVEAIDPKDGKRYRYTGRIDQPWLRDKSYGEWVRQFVLDKVVATGPAPRYGVTYDDISTRAEREYWIAGSSLKVVDLKTNEVMAARIGYMVDRGQGATGTGGGQVAVACCRRQCLSRVQFWPRVRGPTVSNTRFC